MATLAQLALRRGIGLEVQSLTSCTNDAALNVARPKQSVLVRHRCQATCLGCVLTVAKVVVFCHRISVISRVQRLVATYECARLNEDLGFVAGVDAVVDFLKVTVVDVTSAEADGRGARVDVVPVIVALGDVQVARILVAIAVGMTDQRCLPVIVDESTGDGYVVRCMSDLVR